MLRPLVRNAPTIHRPVECLGVAISASDALRAPAWGTEFDNLKSSRQDLVDLNQLSRGFYLDQRFSTRFGGKYRLGN